MNGQTTGNVRAGTIRKRACESALRAFTLIELLVVISIIAVLVAMAMPGLALAQEYARRATCAANLRSIGVGLGLYAHDDKTFPYIPLTGAGWGVAVGTSRDEDPFAETPTGRSATSNLYLLVRSRICPAGLFVCPSTTEREDRSVPSEHWDFAAGTNVSYSLMNPYGSERFFEDIGGSVILLADSSPYFDAATGLRNDLDPVNLAEDPNEADVRRGNSANHYRRGQNTMRTGGSARFEERADCGTDRDNIYTRAPGNKETDSAGDLPDPGPDASAANQGPSSPYDSFLIP